MENCIFCKIIATELPADKIYEDENVVAFLDIQPVNPGHVLVVPRVHSRDFLDIDEASLVDLTKVLPKIGRAVMKGTGASAFNVGLNNGTAAGQIVMHTHIHIIPRFDGDALKSWGGGAYKKGEAVKVAESIRQAIL